MRLTNVFYRTLRKNLYQKMNINYWRIFNLNYYQNISKINLLTKFISKNKYFFNKLGLKTQL